MRKLFLLLLLGLLWAPAQAQTIGPPNAVLCNQIAVMAAGPTTVQQLVALTAGQRIYFCGWHTTNTAAAGTFTITAGTQTTNPCDTGTQTITPALNVTSSAPSSDHIDYATTQTAIGAQLCFTPSVATIATVLYYSKF